MRFRAGATDVDRELRVMNSTVFEALRPFLLDGVRALQSACTPADYVALESGLLKQFLRHQLTQEQTRERLVALKTERAILTRQLPKPIASIRALSEEIETDEFFDHVLGCALHAFRCLGDGIAWKALDFDRRVITVMGDGHRVGRLADETGLAAELAELDRLWTEEHQFAIHNDLTNCLRHADLTIPGTPIGRREIEVAEVKASGKQKTIQRSRLAEKLQFVNTGYRPSADGSPASRILPAMPRLRTFLGPLRVAIARARKVGVADFSPHRCMTVAVADYYVLDRTPELADDWASGAPRRRGWDPSHPRVIQSLGFVRRLRERHNSFAFIAPYAIFPLDPADAADLILGHLEVCTTISGDELENTFTQAGLQSEVAGGSDAEHLLLRATDGAATVELPAVIREQMVTELVSPDTIIDAVLLALASTAADPAKQPARQLVPYAGERAVWAPIMPVGRTSRSGRRT